MGHFKNVEFSRLCELQRQRHNFRQGWWALVADYEFNLRGDHESESASASGWQLPVVLAFSTIFTF